MPRKPSGKKPYFGPEQDAFIREWMQAPDTATKHRIYTQHLHPVFTHLATLLIRTLKFKVDDDAVPDMVGHLYHCLQTFDPAKCHVAFGYFNKCGLNFLKARYNADKLYHSRYVHDPSDDDSPGTWWNRAMSVPDASMQQERHDDLFLQLRALTDVSHSRSVQVSRAAKVVLQLFNGDADIPSQASKLPIRFEDRYLMTAALKQRLAELQSPVSGSIAA